MLWIILNNCILYFIYSNLYIISLLCLNFSLCFCFGLCLLFITACCSCRIYYIFLYWTIFCSDSNCSCISSRIHFSSADADFSIRVIGNRTYNKFFHIRVNRCIICCNFRWKCWWKRSRTYLKRWQCVIWWIAYRCFSGNCSWRGTYYQSVFISRTYNCSWCNNRDCWWTRIINFKLYTKTSLICR